MFPKNKLNKFKILKMNKNLIVHYAEELVKIKIYYQFIWKNIIERKNMKRHLKIKNNYKI